MSTFTFEGQRIPAGIITFQIVTDSGSSLFTVTSKCFFRVERLARVIEESGYGGVIKVDDADFEVFDKEDYFKNYIFADGVTPAKIIVWIDYDGTSYPVFYGDIDPETVEWNLVFTDKWTIRFSAFSILKRLETEIDWDEFRDTILTYFSTNVAYANLSAYSIYGGAPDHVRFIKFSNLIRIFQDKLDDTLTAEIDATARFHCASLGVSDVELKDIYIPFCRVDSSTPAYDSMFGTASDSAYMGLLTGLKTWWDVLRYIAEMFGQTLIAKLPTVGHVQIALVQRGTGDVVSPNGIMKGLMMARYSGYEIIRVGTSIGGWIHDTVNPWTNKPALDLHAQAQVAFRPLNTTDDAFEKEERKLNTEAIVELKEPDGYPFNWTHPWKLWTNDGTDWSPIEQITDAAYAGDRDGTLFNPWLADKQSNNWSRDRGVTAKELWFCNVSYSGMGLELDLNQKLTIDDVDYTIIEINRNIAEDETTVKAVNY